MNKKSFCLTDIWAVFVLLWGLYSLISPYVSWGIKLSVQNNYVENILITVIGLFCVFTGILVVMKKKLGLYLAYVTTFLLIGGTTYSLVVLPFIENVLFLIINLIMLIYFITHRRIFT